MATERLKLIPSVYLILIKDGRVLLSRRANTGYEDGNYGLVAGHAESGEKFTDGLAREIQEEAGIELEGVKHVLTMHRNCVDHERVDLFFTADSWMVEITNMESDKCDDISWWPINELPKNIIPYIRKAIECCNQGINYCEYGWEPGEVYRTV